MTVRINRSRPNLMLAAMWSLLAGIGSCHVAAGLDDLETEALPPIVQMCEDYCRAAEPYPACKVLGCSENRCINGFFWNSFLWCRDQIIAYGNCLTRADPSSIRCEDAILQPNELTCAQELLEYYTCLGGPGDSPDAACETACGKIFAEACGVDLSVCIDGCISGADSSQCPGQASALIHCAAANPDTEWSCDVGEGTPVGALHPCYSTYVVLVTCLGG